jgi:hypothetical protein
MDNTDVASPRERLALAAFALVLAAILAVHAGFETLFVLPSNPIGERLRPLVLAYTHPYFEQYWNMFAPAPIASDIIVLARTRDAAGAQSAWVSLTDPLIDKVRANPLSRYSTLKNVAMTLGLAALADKTLIKGKLTRAQLRTLMEPKTRPMFFDGLLRLAVFLRAGEGTDVRSMQIQIIDHEFPRFSHRFERDDVRLNNHAMILPWVPVSRTDGSTS